MTDALNNCRYFEVGGGVGASYASKLLADLGADVIKVELPEGDALRQIPPLRRTPRDLKSALFEFYNTSKRSILMDYRSRRGSRLLGEMVAACNALIVNDDDEAARDWVRGAWTRGRDFPPVVAVRAMPAEGRYAAWKGGDALAQALAGVSHEIGEPGRAPLCLPLRQSEHLAGALAALLALACARGVRDRRIIVSGTKVLATLLIGHGAYVYRYWNQVPGRHGRRSVTRPYPSGFFRCRDGLVAIHSADDVMWRRLQEMMGEPGWCELDTFQDRLRVAAECPEAMDRYLNPWLSRRRRAHLFSEALRARMALAPVLTNTEVLTTAHHHARGFWRSPEGDSGLKLPGPPYQLSETAVRCTPAPEKGEHTEDVLGALGSGSGTQASDSALAKQDGRVTGETFPLAGVRVIEFGWVLAGTLPGLLLADLGAEVIKVESKSRLDLNRQGPPVVGTESGPEQNPRFHSLNRNKLSFTADLGNPMDIPTVRDLCRHADVLVENFSSGVMEKLGLGYSLLRTINPRLIYLSISVAGQSGPWAPTRGYAITAAALSGLTSLEGYEGEDPCGDHFMYPDVLAGLHGTVAVLAALESRNGTGRGQFIDVSMIDSLINALSGAALAASVDNRELTPIGWRDALSSMRGTFPCQRRDSWVAIEMSTASHWSALCQVTDDHVLRDETRFGNDLLRGQNRSLAEERITRWTKRFHKAEAARRLQAAGVPAAPVLDLAEHLSDPGLREAKFYEDIDHPVIGREKVIAVPWDAEPQLGAIRHRAPLLGEHSEAILADVIGMSSAEIKNLKARGALE